MGFWKLSTEIPEVNNEPWLQLTPQGLRLYLPLLLQHIDCCSALQGRYSPGELVQILGRIQNPEWGEARTTWAQLSSQASSSWHTASSSLLSKNVVTKIRFDELAWKPVFKPENWSFLQGSTFFKAHVFFIVPTCPLIQCFPTLSKYTNMLLWSVFYQCRKQSVTDRKLTSFLHRKLRDSNPAGLSLCVPLIRQWLLETSAPELWQLFHIKQH